MTDISLTNPTQPVHIKEQFVVLLKTVFRAVTRGLPERRCLSADLDELPDHILQDIGLSRNDVRDLSKGTAR